MHGRLPAPNPQRIIVDSTKSDPLRLKGSGNLATTGVPSRTPARIRSANYPATRRIAREYRLSC